MNLLQNIANNINELRQDFIGLSLNLSGIGYFFLHILIAVSLFILFYFLGKKIRRLFFREQKESMHFINIALGYLVIGIGLGVLGMFSLLSPQVITVYLFIVLLIAFYAFPYQKLFSINLKQVSFNILSTNKFVIFGVLLFVLIAFLRLMTPEIAEDGYHTDNATLFVQSQTILHESRDSLHTLPFPQLPEMIYMIPIFLGDKEAARFIHFGFYLTVILLFFAVTRNKMYSFAQFLPLIFVTAPVMIRISSTQYTDFFALFMFLLSMILIKRKMTKKTIILSGILFGAVVSAKVWMLVYLPAVLIYLFILNRKLPIKKLFLIITLFVGAYLVISSLWYVRAYFISGNPIFPIMNTFFIKEQPFAFNPIPYFGSGHYLGFNIKMFYPENLIGLSPFFYLSIVAFILSYRKKMKTMLKTPLIILFIILTIEQLLIHVEWGRYLIIWCLVSSIFISFGLKELYKNRRWFRYSLIFFFSIFFFYYLINSFFRLPYGFGWADKNAYLTRILSRDNVSYYDFNRSFRKWISDKDIVATYHLANFYYADFTHIDVGYIYDKKSQSFTMMKKKGITKLLIQNGDIHWFCNELELTECSAEEVELIATYPQDLQRYNLYKLK